MEEDAAHSSRLGLAQAPEALLSAGEAGGEQGGRPEAQGRGQCGGREEMCGEESSQVKSHRL